MKKDVIETLNGHMKTLNQYIDFKHQHGSIDQFAYVVLRVLFDNITKYINKQ